MLKRITWKSTIVCTFTEVVRQNAVERREEDLALLFVSSETTARKIDEKSKKNSRWLKRVSI